MNLAEFLRRPRRLTSGVLRASPRLVTLCAAIAASGAYSGCLLGRRFVPDDADLDPVVPPAIIPDGLTDPLPGAVIVLTPGDSMSHNFTVAVSGGLGPLVYRFIKDRPRPCSGPDCGRVDAQGMVDPYDNGGMATFSRPLSFNLAGHCTRVDLYVSSAFRDPDLPTTPVRDGDIAFARWYVVTPNINGDPVPASACQDQ